jgi:hypothetical protein
MGFSSICPLESHKRPPRQNSRADRYLATVRVLRSRPAAFKTAPLEYRRQVKMRQPKQCIARSTSYRRTNRTRARALSDAARLPPSGLILTTVLLDGNTSRRTPNITASLVTPCGAHQARPVGLLAGDPAGRDQPAYGGN